MTKEEYSKEELKFILDAVQLVYRKGLDKERSVFILKQVIKGVEGQIMKEELKAALKKEYPDLFKDEDVKREDKIDTIVTKILSGLE